MEGKMPVSDSDLDKGFTDHTHDQEWNEATDGWEDTGSDVEMNEPDNRVWMPNQGNWG